MPLDLWVTEYDSRTPGMHKAMRNDPRIHVATTFCWDDRTMVFDFGMIGLDGRHKRSFTDFAVAAGNPVEPPPPPEFQFVLGFKQIADRHPSLIGDPLENEAGIVMGNSFQHTSNGWLYWGNIVGSGDTKGFLTNGGERFLWDGQQLQRVAA